MLLAFMNTHVNPILEHIFLTFFINCFHYQSLVIPTAIEKIGNDEWVGQKSSGRSRNLIRGKGTGVLIIDILIGDHIQYIGLVIKAN